MVWSAWEVVVRREGGCGVGEFGKEGGWVWREGWGGGRAGEVREMGMLRDMVFGQMPSRDNGRSTLGVLGLTSSCGRWLAWGFPDGEGLGQNSKQCFQPFSSWQS